MLNFRQLAWETGKTQSEIGEIIGVPQSVVSNMSKGFRQVRKEHIDKLRAAFGDALIDRCIIPDDAVDTHAGARMVQATILPATVVDDIKEELSRPKIEDLEVVEPEEVELKETVILTPEIVNQPGIDIRKELEEDNLPVTTKYTQDIVPLHDAKVYLENDEMAPEIEANDPVLIRFMDSTAVVPGRMYFIDLYRGGVVRWVFPQEDGSLILRSTNTPDMHVPADSVKSISEVVAIWKRPKSMQTERITIMEELRRRDDQMDQLIELNKASGERESRLIDLLEKKN